MICREADIKNGVSHASWRGRRSGTVALFAKVETTMPNHRALGLLDAAIVTSRDATYGGKKKKEKL
jgi:hypothetical protein